METEKKNAAMENSDPAVYIMYLFGLLACVVDKIRMGKSNTVRERKIEASLNVIS